MTEAISIRPQDFEIARNILQDCLPIEQSRVFVFGSRATGTLKRAADLDLAIDLGRPLTQAEINNLKDQFEDSDLPYRVDIVDLQTVSPAFKTIIEQSMREFLNVDHGFQSSRILAQ